MNEKPWEVDRFEEDKDGYKFLLVGKTVIFIQFGGGYIDLQLNDDFMTFVRLAMPFEWKEQKRNQVFNPEEVLSLAPLLSLIGKTIVKAEATKKGFLSLAFDDGLEIEAPSDGDGHDYEAWQIEDRHGYLVVCAIGGEVFIWMPSEAVSNINNRRST